MVNKERLRSNLITHLESWGFSILSCNEHTSEHSTHLTYGLQVQDKGGNTTVLTAMLVKSEHTGYLVTLGLPLSYLEEELGTPGHLN